jgi:UDP-2,3-diacylglucosamine pyrophosphatase LpxH
MQASSTILPFHQPCEPSFPLDNRMSRACGTTASQTSIMSLQSFSLLPRRDDSRVWRRSRTGPLPSTFERTSFERLSFVQRETGRLGRRGIQFWHLALLWALVLRVGSFAAGAAEPFFFIQLSDPQFGMFTEDKNFVQETANYEFAIATVNRLRPAFVVVTGDLVNRPGDREQIAEYLRITAKVDKGIPVHNVAGNHDVGNVPTPQSLADYRKDFGPDYYSFRHGTFFGVVMNSCLVHSPTNTMKEMAEQEAWLRAELQKARAGEAKHIAVFQHHPWFLKSATEADEYFNIPQERRSRYLALFREFGVKKLFCGHYHRNAIARDGELEVITTGPVGKPLGNDGSGLRIIQVRDEGIEHRYFEFDKLPNSISLTNFISGK